jgi:hypothetical protein
MWTPWLAHLFPGVTVPELEAGNWTMAGYVAMLDMARDR